MVKTGQNKCMGVSEHFWGTCCGTGQFQALRTRPSALRSRHMNDAGSVVNPQTARTPRRREVKRPGPGQARGQRGERGARAPSRRLSPRERQPRAATLMMIFSRSWLGDGSWSALASVGLVSSRSPNASLNTLAMWRCCCTQQCSSMDRITGKLRAGREGGALGKRDGPRPRRAAQPGLRDQGVPCALGLGARQHSAGASQQ